MRGVWSVAKNRSTAGNLRDLLGERKRKRERGSCDAGCLQYMPHVRSSKAGGIMLEVEQRQEALLE